MSWLCNSFRPFVSSQVRPCEHQECLSHCSMVCEGDHLELRSRELPLFHILVSQEKRMNFVLELRSLINLMFEKTFSSHYGFASLHCLQDKPTIVRSSFKYRYGSSHGHSVIGRVCFHCSCEHFIILHSEYLSW